MKSTISRKSTADTYVQLCSVCFCESMNDTKLTAIQNCFNTSMNEFNIDISIIVTNWLYNIGIISTRPIEQALNKAFGQGLRAMQLQIQT